MNKIQKLAEILQAAAKREGVESTSASFDIYDGCVTVHMLEGEFDKCFPLGAGVIVERGCTRYPIKQTVTTKSGVKILCLREHKSEAVS